MLFLLTFVCTSVSAFLFWRWRRRLVPRLADIAPKKYRPYKPGPYHVNMGIRPMKLNEWIELDWDFERYQRIKKKRLATRGDVVCVRDKGRAAAVELLDELATFLAGRYPRDFSRTATSVTVLGERYELPNGGEPDAAERALKVAALLVQDDLVIMMDTDGEYFLEGGAVCLAGFWRLRDKLGLSLDEIHLRGGVPLYRERLQPSMGRYFRKLTSPVVRFGYFFQTLLGDEDDELAWGSSLGPEDTYGDGHSHERQPATTIGQVRLRVERQSLRRLAKSGAIVFTVRTYMRGVEGIEDELLAAIDEWPPAVAEYKGQSGWGHVMESNRRKQTPVI